MVKGAKQQGFPLTRFVTHFDEVGELPAETQISLLRVLQEHEFQRVGGTQAIQADVRLIAATNRDLKTAVSKGAFRSDLFFRLNVFPIEMPSLRSRSEDIALLTEYFVQPYAHKLGKKISSISKRTLVGCGSSASSFARPVPSPKAHSKGMPSSCFMRLSLSKAAIR